MLDFPNMKDCDVDEWEAIVDQFILSNKSKKTSIYCVNRTNIDY